MSSPLQHWSTDDVFAFVEAEGLTLPSHYAEIPTSLDCWICPAHWGTTTAPPYGRYLAREYPEMARMVMPNARKIHAHTRAVVDDMERALAGAESEL